MRNAKYFVRARRVAWRAIGAAVLVSGAAGAVPAGAAGSFSIASASPLALAVAGCVESFDVLSAGNSSTSLPPGAAFDESGTSALADGLYTADNGGSNAGDVKSLGATGSLERSFGSLLSSSLTPAIGVLVRNDTGATITSLSVSYTLEQWRQGGTSRFDRLNFAYSTASTTLAGGGFVNVTALDGVAPNGGATTGALDGNAAANRVTVASTIGLLSIAPVGTIVLRWTDFNAAGSDDALSVDNLALVANGGATPTALCSTPPAPSVARIHDVQGPGAVSPVVGQTKTVEGIVVGLDDQVGASFGSGNTINTFPNDRGFFLQEEDTDADTNPLTSEGVFVGLTSSATPLPAVGDKVTVTGIVRDGQSPPSFGQTKLEAASYTVVSSGNALPAVALIDIAQASTQAIGAETNATRSYYETLEGMRVSLAAGVARSGGTNKFGELFVVPGSTGGTLLRTDPMPPGLMGTAADAGAGNPPNPYDPPAPSTTIVQADKGDTVAGLIGPLGYTFGHYKVVVQVGALPTITKTGVGFPYDRLAPPAPHERRVTSFNLENFFPEGGALDGHIVSLAEFESKRDRAADAIGRLLHAPDVIAVQEIGDNQHLGQSGTTTSLGTLQALALRLTQWGYGGYTAYALEGNDNRGIDVGFLIKHTVTVLAGPDQMGGLTEPGSCSDVAGRLFDRPPLFLRVDLGAGLGPVWVVSNHFSSKAAPDSCRIAQATFVRDKVKALELDGNQVIVMGDINAFEDEGALATLEDGQTTLDNLWSTVPHDEAYSFQFGGVLQTLDHVLVTSGIGAQRTGFTYAHISNDYYDRGTEGYKVSDHDPPVLTLSAMPPVEIPDAPWPVLFGLSAAAVAALTAAFGRRRDLSRITK